MQDLFNKIQMTVIHQKSLATAGAILGSLVFDTAPYDSIVIHASKAAGTATTRTFIIDLESGPLNATTAHTSATTSEVLGSNVVTMTATTANALKLGYIGKDRFISVAVTAGAATGAITIVAIGSNKRKQPTGVSV